MKLTKIYDSALIRERYGSEETRILTAQKVKFSIKDFLCNCDQNPQFPGDMVIFTEEILNGKASFLR